MPAENVPSKALIARWRSRRRAILAHYVPPEVIKEYRKLGMLIKEVESAQKHTEETAQVAIYKNLREELQQIPTLEPNERAKRMKLSIQRARLLNYLYFYGPADRQDIAKHTGIAVGSLSKLLSGKDFVSVERGIWTISEKARQKLSTDK